MSYRPPPKEQGYYERWSLVFFTRPGQSVILRPLSDESPVIAEAVSKLPSGKYDTGTTSKEWFARRIKNQRIKNRTVRANLLRGLDEADVDVCAFSGSRNLEGQ